MKYQTSFIAVLLLGLLFVAMRPAAAQSSEQSLPTAVLANEINGRIPARDLGDPRLTRHFYAFEGTPGDLLITLDSKNLNGDIDVFTAVTFRPLMKTSMYANALSQEVTKGLYLRTKQILILRVEARTPNDDEGSYHVRFGGSFQPFSGGIPVAQNSEPSDETTPAGRGNKRLSSAGATIVEPVTETPSTVEPKASEAKTADKTAEEKEAAKKTTTAKTTRTGPARSSTARNPRGRGTRPAPSKPVAVEKKPNDAKTETDAAKTATSSPGEEKSASSEKTKAQEIAVAQPGARLIIEEKDGTKIERPMSTVRRVVVEGNMIVIVLKTGKIERVPMSVVARMAIEPQ